MANSHKAVETAKRNRALREEKARAYRAECDLIRHALRSVLADDNATAEAKTEAARMLLEKFSEWGFRYG